MMRCVLSTSGTSLGWGEVSLGCAQVQVGLQSIAVRVCEGGLGWGRGQFCPEWPGGLFSTSREVGGAVWGALAFSPEWRGVQCAGLAPARISNRLVVG